MPDKVLEFNPGRHSWKINAHNITSISGDDLIIEVPENNNIIFKEGDTSYNISNFISSDVSLINYADASFGNVDISGNLDVSGNIYINGALATNFQSVELENSLQYYIPLTDGIVNSGTQTLYDILIEVSNNKAPISNPTFTGTVTSTSLQVDNINIDNNIISSTNTNGNIVLEPNGTGHIQIKSNIIPDSDNTYDIGSATNRIRDLYISESSIIMGDNILTLEGTESNKYLTTKKLKNNYQSLISSSANIRSALNLTNDSNLFNTRRKIFQKILAENKNYKSDHISSLFEDDDLSGTLITAAQPNITSLGNLTNLTVAGNLTVNGTTTTVNSTTVTIDDPIFTLGGDSAGLNDSKDRGIEFKWHNGSGAKVGFFGFDHNEGKFTFIPDATNNSEVFSGAVGTIKANLEGNASGTAATVTQAAQTAITSVGTLSSLNVSGNTGIGTTSPIGKLHIYETGSGTAANHNAGTILLQHQNSGGSTSIVFRSAINLTSDFGAIQYTDSTDGGTNEKSILRLIAENDGNGSTEDEIRFKVDGADRVTIASDNVGIGYTSPSYKLDINGTCRASYFYATGGFRNYWWNSSFLIQTSNSSGSFSTKMTIEPGGDVGIGTTNPDHKLHVKGNIVSENGATDSTTSRNTGLHAWTDRAFGLELHHDGSSWCTALFGRTTDPTCIRFGSYAGNATAQNTFQEKMRILNSGYVGIGTVSPSEKLHVDGNLLVTGSIRGAYDTNVTSYLGRAAIGYCGWTDYASFAHLDSNTTTGYALKQHPGGDTFINSPATKQIQMRINNDPKLTLKTNGNVGIGVTNPDEKLEVNGASHFGNRIDIYVGGGSMCGQLGSQGDLGGLTGLAQTDFGIKTTLGGFGIATSGSASTRLYIKSDGFVGINTTSPTTLFEISKAQSDTIDATNAFLALKGSGGDGILMGQTSSSPYGAWIQAGNVPNPSNIPYPLYLNPHGGNVGIGTTSPLSVLHINHSNAMISVTDSDTGSGATNGLYLQQHGTSSYLINRENDKLVIGTNNDDKMTILANGNVGIGTGTTNPAELLEISSSGTTKCRIEYASGSDKYGEFQFYEGGTLRGGIRSIASNYTTTARQKDTEIFSAAVGSDITFWPDGACAMTVKDGGNVGIGTTTPQSLLHVDKGRIDITTSDGTGGGNFRFNGLRGPNDDNYRRAQLVLSSGYSDLVIASSQTNDNHGSTLTFATANPSNAADYAKFVINQGNWGNRKGFLDFGYRDWEDTNPHSYISSTYTTFTINGANRRCGIKNINPGWDLDVAGQTYVSSNIALKGNIYCGYDKSNWNGGTGCNIYCTGNITAYYSDERLKENLGKIENPIDKVKNIETFYFKENNLAESFGFKNKKTQVGLSAQSVEKIMPEIVCLAPFDFSMNDDGSKTSKSGENYKTVDYAKLVPLLIEAIKEQQKTIDELKKDVENLKNK
tara:strand:+ start:5437 stop:9744 length:4308 start_codon:yes stop_codon:yes gene_type:complete